MPTPLLLLTLSLGPVGDVLVDRDDVVVRESCTLRFGEVPVADVNGDGVVHVVGDGIVVDLAGGTLRGAAGEAAPDSLSGVGVHISGKRVTLRHGAVTGFKTAVLARGADGLVIEDLDVSGNFRQRLGSTPDAPVGGDRLEPHVNDGDEWLARYGAGIWIGDSRDVTVRRCRARRGQNGLVLDRVDDSRAYDNDLSFLSGWGIALWRANGNTITRNACDFCVRGGGQGSAGILLTEQCSRNLVAENSATHCGVGLLGFAGREALGEHPAPAEDFDLEGRGSNQNVVADNDLSYAATHGMELTFGFRNAIVRNRLVENAACGILASGSHGAEIGWNDLIGNGGAPGGSGRAAIEIEHGRGNQIVENTFRDNACGVRISGDGDARLRGLPWAAANGLDSRDTIVVLNRFEGDAVAVEVRKSTDLLVSANEFFEVGAEVVADGVSTLDRGGFGVEVDGHDGHEMLGGSNPVGARAHLRGRDRILLTPWGPFDWEQPLLQRVETGPQVHEWRLLGDGKLQRVAVLEGLVDTRLELGGEHPHITVVPRKPGVHPYRLEARTDRGPARASGVLVSTTWSVVFFPFEADPLEDLGAWRDDAKTGAVRGVLPALQLAFGDGGPSDLDAVPGQIRDARLPADRFGTIAATRLYLPAGRWRLRTRSDDGVRVNVDGEVVLERWTRHETALDEVLLERPTGGDATILIEHFDLDGNAELRLDLELELELE